MKQIKPYQITYQGKSSEKEVLESSNVANLRLTKVYGDVESSPTNSLVYGDNIRVLRSLLKNKKIKGKVKLIYIDPPFATNQTFHGKKLQPAYEDELCGAAYLEFMRKRLILMRELLSKDGSIYVHLDSNMAFEIKLIMDEVFGASNFRNWISRKKSNRKNYTRKTYGNIQDFILFYTKTNKYTWNRPYQERGIYSLEERFPKLEKETGRRYALVPIHAPGTRNGATGSKWRGKNPPPGKHWMYTPDKLDAFDKKGEIYWSPTGNPRRKIYADNDKGVPIQDIWLEFKDAHNQNIAITGYPTEKNIDLLKRIIEASSDEGDLVLDAFSGSGTTLAAAKELKRKWIGIDNSKLAIYISFKRLLDSCNKSKQLMLDQTASLQTDLGVYISERDPKVVNGNHKPEVKMKLTQRKSTLILEVEDFQSKDDAAKKHTKNKLNLLGMITVDTNYDDHIFKVKHCFSGDIVKKNGRVEFAKPQNTSKVAIAVTDIFGNEILVVEEI